MARVAILVVGLDIATRDSSSPPTMNPAIESRQSRWRTMLADTIGECWKGGGNRMFYVDVEGTGGSSSGGGGGGGGWWRKGKSRQNPEQSGKLSQRLLWGCLSGAPRH